MVVAVQQSIPIPPPLLPLGPGIHPQHVPSWTDLAQEGNGTYKQTAQHPEINACLSAMVKHATTNLVLVNAFPSLHDRDAWTLATLRMELSIRWNDSPVINAVAEQVNDDKRYLNCLFSMVTASSRTQIRDSTTLFQVNGCWSGFRQGVIQVARELILSSECSYSVHGPMAEVVPAALALLERDSFHFGRSITVSLRAGNFQTRLPEFTCV